MTHWGSELGLSVLNGLAELYTSLVWESTLLLALCSDDIIPPGCKFGKEDMEKLLPSEMRVSVYLICKNFLLLPGHICFVGKNSVYSTELQNLCFYFCLISLSYICGLQPLVAVHCVPVTACVRSALAQCGTFGSYAVTSKLTHGCRSCRFWGLIFLYLGDGRFGQCCILAPVEIVFAVHGTGDIYGRTLLKLIVETFIWLMLSGLN